MNTKLRNSYLAIGLMTMSIQAQALTVNGVLSDAAAGTTLATAWLGASSGVTIVGPVNYVGSTTTGQAGTYTDLTLNSSVSDAAHPDIALGNGIVMTSGTTAIPTSNTQSSFGVDLGLAGDPAITALSGNPSFDANSLSFSFKVASGITSISTNFIFGSDEYPEFAGTSFSDGFAFIVDGKNYAKFADGSAVSLKTLGSNNNLLNNTTGAYGIEYDGITQALTIDGLLDNSLSTHTLKIVISDTGDGVYDSGVFLSSLSAGKSDTGGVKPPPGAVPEPEVYAMMLAGLGLVGYAARRRKAAK
ncbi:MAG TPA: choice-of-anchor L domain-containing protein [Methylophilaceae bacterium]|jgi:hypothetical protein